MKRRDFLGALAASTAGILIPDWGRRVFPMHPRTGAPPDFHPDCFDFKVPPVDLSELGLVPGDFIAVRIYNGDGEEVTANGRQISLDEASRIFRVKTIERDGSFITVGHATEEP